MKTRSLAFLLPLLSFAPSVGAAPTSEGGNGSHGGNAVVCFYDTATLKSVLRQTEDGGGIPNSALSQISLIRMLDLYSLNRKTGLDASPVGAVPLFEPLPRESNSAYVERLARRFDGASPYLASLLRDGFRDFEGKVTLRNASGGFSGIFQVNDYGNLGFKLDETHCLIATIASQDDAGNLEIDDRLYHHAKHSEISRKAVILHEILFRHEIKLGNRAQWNIDVAPVIRSLTAAFLEKRASREKILSLLPRLYINYIKQTGGWSGNPSFKYVETMRSETIGLEEKLSSLVELTKKGAASAEAIESDYKRESFFDPYSDDCYVDRLSRRCGPMSGCVEMQSPSNFFGTCAAALQKGGGYKDLVEQKRLRKEADAAQKRSRRLELLPSFESTKQDAKVALTLASSQRACGNARLNEAEFENVSAELQRGSFANANDFLGALVERRALPACDVSL